MKLRLQYTASEVLTLVQNKANCGHDTVQNGTRKVSHVCVASHTSLVNMKDVKYLNRTFLTNLNVAPSIEARYFCLVKHPARKKLLIGDVCPGLKSSLSLY
jgi:hypothetical protein